MYSWITLSLHPGYLLINAFASKDYQGSNNVVIAHELMHTFGASDKYGPDGEPVYPEGYADAYQDPLYPQTRAEIMGGRIALSQTKSKMPEGLSNVAVGAITALAPHRFGCPQQRYRFTNQGNACRLSLDILLFLSDLPMHDI